MRAFRRERHTFRPTLDSLCKRIAPCNVIGPAVTTEPAPYFAPIDSTTAIVAAPNLTGSPTTSTDLVCQDLTPVN